MREIKFRAFCPIDKVMIYDLNSPTIWHGVLVPCGDDILMQFTGLRDKNGREIYEGDIIGDRTDGREYRVDFHDGFYSAHGKLGAPFALVKVAGYLEVIGNIHENPELLK